MVIKTIVVVMDIHLLIHQVAVVLQDIVVMDNEVLVEQNFLPILIIMVVDLVLEVNQ